jgi:hypothetical protein
MIRFSLLFSLPLAGCADASLRGAAELLDTGGQDAAYDTAVKGEDTSLPEDPAWYVVRAELPILGGVAAAEGATVALDVVDRDRSRVNCSVELDASGLTAGTVAAADPGSVWWALPVVDTTDVCAPLPETLLLGVGVLGPDVRARLGTVGQDAVANSLYGAYLVLDDAAVVFGYAGTATDLLGDDVAVLPPPDGLYRVAPLYLVPLPG